MPIKKIGSFLSDLSGFPGDKTDIFADCFQILAEESEIGKDSSYLKDPFFLSERSALFFEYVFRLNGKMF